MPIVSGFHSINCQEQEGRNEGQLLEKQFISNRCLWASGTQAHSHRPGLPPDLLMHRTGRPVHASSWENASQAQGVCRAATSLSAPRSSLGAQAPSQQTPNPICLSPPSWGLRIDQIQGTAKKSLCKYETRVWMQALTFMPQKYH